MNDRIKLVVIGNGMVGHRLLEALATGPAAGRLAITAFCEEPRVAYDRVHLTEFFSGRDAEALSLVEPGFYERHGIRVLTGDAVVAIDRDARTVTVGGKPCELTSYQFDLLITLAERAGRVLTRDQIMEAVRGRELEAFDRSIDVHMGRIRAAIEADPKNPKRILTVRGVGYVFAKQQD